MSCKKWFAKNFKFSDRVIVVYLLIFIVLSENGAAFLVVLVTSTDPRIDSLPLMWCWILNMPSIFVLIIYMPVLLYQVITSFNIEARNISFSYKHL